jgi:hypothetical protein
MNFSSGRGNDDLADADDRDIADAVHEAIAMAEGRASAPFPVSRAGPDGA